MQPAKLLVISDCCINLVTACASLGLAARLDQRRCAYALSIMLAWMTHLILRFNSPLIAGVCVCGHEVWDRNGATIETGALSEVSLTELGSACVGCIYHVVQCGTRVSDGV